MTFYGERVIDGHRFKAYLEEKGGRRLVLLIWYDDERPAVEDGQPVLPIGEPARFWLSRDKEALPIFNGFCTGFVLGSGASREHVPLHCSRVADRPRSLRLDAP